MRPMLLPRPEPVSYGYTRTLAGASFEEAVERTTSALKAEGFGVLTTIDVKDTLKKKLGEDFRKYVILGACNPKLAHQALLTELSVGLLLPCNVCVYEGEDHQPVIQAINPRAMFEIVKRPDLEPIVAEAEQRLRRAFDAIAREP